eukprot:SAG22_NODE_234_length_14360_cov_13.245915_8_plen_181_part_00
MRCRQCLSVARHPRPAPLLHLGLPWPQRLNALVVGLCATGIEVVDGIPRLSCVCCNVYADWSTQVWTEPALRIRVHKLRQSVVVEAAKLGTDDFAFIRICHLAKAVGQPGDPLAAHPNVLASSVGPSPPDGSVWLGVFACCPEEQAGCTATFHDFSIKEGTTFEHDAGGAAGPDDDAAAL